MNKGLLESSGFRQSSRADISHKLLEMLKVPRDPTLKPMALEKHFG